MPAFLLERRWVAAPVAVAWLLMAPGGWAQWTVGVGGNPARNGLSSQVGPGAPAVLWQTGISAIVAQQAVIDGDLVVTSRITSFALPNGTSIVGQDLNTGATRWQVQIPAGFPSSWRSRVTGIANGQVYATRSGNTNAEYLYALSPATGAILWQSQALVTESSTESVTYAQNGDIISTGVNAAGTPVLVCIDHLNGATRWMFTRTCPTSGGCDAAVSGNRVYFFEAGAAGPVITVADIATGVRLYSSPGLGGGFAQQVAPFVAPNGRIYAPRTQNNPLTDALFSLTDTGTAFVVNWSVPIGYVPFASHGVGNDGSIYTWSPALEIIRLDPASGAVWSRSAPVVHDSPMQPRMAIDAQGKVFVTNGGFGLGRLSVFTPDLRPIWSVAMPNVNVGGPALGQNGTLVVCGVGTDIRAYRSACAGWFSAAYGAPCAGTGGLLPAFSGAGCPAPGGVVSVSVANGRPGAFALLALGLGPGSFPVTPSCSAYIDPWTGFLVPIFLDGAGAATLAFAISPAIVAADAFAQVFIDDPGASGQIAATNALQAHIE